MTPRLEVLDLDSSVMSAVATRRHLGICTSPDRHKTWDNILAIQDLLDLSRDAPILDVGCGSGILLVWLRQLGFRELWGIDPRHPLPPVKAAIRKGLPRTAVASLAHAVTSAHHLKRAPAEHLPLPDQSFDAVASMSVIEHGVHVPTFLNESRRVLRPRGRLILSTDYWHEPVDRKSYLFGRSDIVFSPEGIEELLALAADAGFDVPGLPSQSRSRSSPVIQQAACSYTFLYIAMRRLP